MSEKTLRVGILMGSDSDWDKINGVAKALDEFNVGYEIHVMSAHRTPDKVLEYASTAKSRGLRVIIAAAGGAAHLAGVVASHTSLPVIGIPVKTDMMGGLDSLLATVQMPGDVPVATVGTGSGGTSFWQPVSKRVPSPAAPSAMRKRCLRQKDSRPRFSVIVAPKRLQSL